MTVIAHDTATGLPIPAEILDRYSGPLWGQLAVDKSMKADGLMTLGEIEGAFNAAKTRIAELQREWDLIAPKTEPQPAPVAGATYDERTGWTPTVPMAAARWRDREGLAAMVKERSGAQDTQPISVVDALGRVRTAIRESAHRTDVLVLPKPSRWSRFLGWLEGWGRA